MATTIRDLFEKYRRHLIDPSHDRQYRISEFLHDGSSAILSWMERLERHPDAKLRPRPVEVSDVREMAARMSREYRFEVLDILTSELMDNLHVNATITRYLTAFDYVQDQLLRILTWENNSTGNRVGERVFFDAMASCDLIRRCEWLLNIEDQERANRRLPDEEKDKLEEHDLHGASTINAYLHNQPYQFERRDNGNIDYLTMEEALTDYIDQLVEPTVVVEFKSPVEGEEFFTSELDVYGHRYVRKVSPVNSHAYPRRTFSKCAIDSGVALKGVSQAIGSRDDVLVTLTNSIPDKQVWVGGKRQDALGIVRLERDDLDAKLHLYLKDPPA